MSDLVKDLKAAVEARQQFLDEKDEARWDEMLREVRSLCHGVIASHGPALLKLVEGERWIPVSERLPDTDAWVLVCYDGAINCMMYDIKRGYFCDPTHAATHNILAPPTHWMPLPTPPQESNDAET